MAEKAPFIKFSQRRPSAASLIFKTASERNHEIMRSKTAAEHRDALTKLAELRLPLPGVNTEPVTCGGVSCQWVYKQGSSEDRVILYLHGGSWMHGNLITAKMPAELLADETNLRVLVADYRLAPEHPFPAGLDDCEAVFGWLLQNGFDEDHIMLFGDSAGGNLSLALLTRLKQSGRKMPLAAGLASPVPDMTENSEIIKSRDNLIYTINNGVETDIFTQYCRGHNRSDPQLSPLYGDLSGFPPLLIHVGGDEPLAVDCVSFSKKAYSQGVDVTLKVYKEMFHDFTIVGNALKESRISIKEFGEFFTQAGLCYSKL